jgi:hypothetical protein
MAVSAQYFTGHPAAAQAYAWSSPDGGKQVLCGVSSATHYVAGRSRKGGNRRATSWRRVMRVKIFDLSWNVDLNRLENEINVFLAMLPGNAVKHVQSAASSTRTRDTDQMQTDYLVTVWYEGEPKKPAANPRPRNQRGGEIQIRAIIPDRNKIAI